jgi:hypothetical protein
MTTFGHWKQLDVGRHQLRTARQHNILAGIGEVYSTVRNPVSSKNPHLSGPCCGEEQAFGTGGGVESRHAIANPDGPSKATVGCEHQSQKVGLPQADTQAGQLPMRGRKKSGAQGVKASPATVSDRLECSSRSSDRPARSTYNPKIVTAFFAEHGLADGLVFEYRFHDKRLWRFDLCWPDRKVAVEVQGGIFAGGRHNRGAALVKEHEKLNHASAMGYKVLFVQPKDLCLVSTVELVRMAMGLTFP